MSESTKNEIFERMVGRVLTYRPKKINRKKKREAKQASKRA